MWIVMCNGARLLADSKFKTVNNEAVPWVIFLLLSLGSRITFVVKKCPSREKPIELALNRIARLN